MYVIAYISRKGNMQTIRLLLTKVKHDSQLTIFVFFFFSGLAIAIALGMESIVDILPCPLCIIQKYLHGIICLSAGIGLLQRFDETSCIRTCQILLLINFLVALVHCLIYFGVMEDLCLRPNTGYALNSFKELSRKTRPDCRNNVLYLLYIPLPLVNALSSITLFFALFKRKKAETVQQFPLK